MSLEMKSIQLTGPTAEAAAAGAAATSATATNLAAVVVVGATAAAAEPKPPIEAHPHKLRRLLHRRREVRIYWPIIGCCRLILHISEYIYCMCYIRIELPAFKLRHKN